ncbi:MAG: D-alanine--D-alanine ligase [Verrucomicrobiae bacterium]|nr:D-alanine--D-alanine ligase [Verrucomicrobiae bacterium]
MNNGKLKVVVFAGGISNEREISLKSGAMVAEALRSSGYQVEMLDPDPIKGWSLPDETNVVFLALHGTYGEDGQVQMELDQLGIPYTGSGAEASRIGFDKLLTRQHCVAAGVTMPRSFVLKNWQAEMPEGWEAPVVLKPLREGSSVGVEIVDNKEDFGAALRRSLEYGGVVLMEERIIGRELTVGILGSEVLPLVEVCPKSGVYSYESKYTKGRTEYYCPAQVDEASRNRAADLALKTFHAVGAKDYARIDMILDQKGECWVLEINTLPGMSETSLLPKAAAAKGLSYANLCCKILEMALRK